MSKPRNGASPGRRLLELAKRYAELAIDLRSALAEAEGRPWATALVNLARRLPVNLEEAGVNVQLGHLELGPPGPELPILAAIEAKGRPPAKADVPSAITEFGNPVNTDEALDGLGVEVAAEVDRAISPADYLAKCNHCGFTRPHSASGPCPDGHVAGFSYSGPIEAPGDDPMPCFEVVESPTQKARGHIQFHRKDLLEAIEHARVNWPGMHVRPVPLGQEIGPKKGSDGRPKSLPARGPGRPPVEPAPRVPMPVAPKFHAWEMQIHLSNGELKRVVRVAKSEGDARSLAMRTKKAERVKVIGGWSREDYERVYGSRSHARPS